METFLNLILTIEAMTKASAYMAIFMSCIRKMEDGLHNCERKKVDDGGVHAWDEAVALYTGSLEGSEGSGDGVLMYNLADMRCQNFKTCGTDSNSARGTSNVNLQVFDEFRVGQAKLKQRDCSGARSNKARIVQLMTVPLIQGTLRYAYYQGTGELTTESAEAEGATLAAAVLPFVYDCGDEGKKNAAIIYANMKTRHNPTDFKQVKSAFEQSYQCLGITCADVGGVWDTFGNQYRDGAKPCTGNVISSNVKETNDSRNTGLVLGLTLGGASCVLLIVMLSSFLGRKAAPIPAITPPSEIL